MKLTFLIINLLLFTSFHGQKLNLIPYPQEVKINKGFFELKKNVNIYGDETSDDVLYFIDNIKQNKNLNLEVAKKYRRKGKKIHLSFFRNCREPGEKNSDQYAISISENEISVLAYNARGLFYGIQTLLQIIQTSKDDQIPCLEISDNPKFDYRGMHLDVSRHFFSEDEVKKYLDYLAMYKYNKFHWHLTDDQGWRIEIKQYPKLTEVGAWRNGSQVGPYSDMKFDDKKYGGFYTQEQIKEVVAYAKKLHIDVIPEIEMPGHSVAAISAYPQLSCIKGSFEVRKEWGVSENVLCPKEETFKFLENVLDEVMALFPYEYIHIGGDEVPKKVWKESQFVQDLIKNLNLKDEHEMQSYFIARMEKYINSKGKKIIGWDEILEGGLAPNATVMSWTGIKGGVEAAKSGHKAIMTPTSTNYFDYYQGNPETEPLAFGGDIRLDKVYGYNPIPKELTKEQEIFIWGTQGNLWTEYIPDFQQAQYMIFPRMMALSEVAWGTSNPVEYKNFESRVIEHFNILDLKKIRYSKAIFEVRGSVSKSNEGKIFYTLSTAKDINNIRYTTDGSEPNADSKSYKNPLEINQSLVVKSAYFEGKNCESNVNIQAFYFSKSTGKKIELQNLPSEAYSVGGASSLTNAVRGNIKAFGKNWLGFLAKDCIATIDLGRKTEFTNIQFSSVERKGSWIYLPKSAKVSVSDDGKNFAVIKTEIPTEIINKEGLVNITFPKQNASFIKIEIQNYGIIPDGQEGAGNPSWLFVDELSVN